MKRFWISASICFISINTLAAVLYAGVPPMDGGSGFISLSPFVDCVFWGAVIAVSGIVMLLSLRKSRPGVPRSPQAMRFPAAYLVTLAGLSALILLMGICQLLYEFSPVHLPLWGYVGIIILLYLVCGFFTGRKYGGQIWSGLLWGLGIAAVLMGMRGMLLHQIQLQDAPWQMQIAEGTYGAGYTGRLMDTFLGGILGRINLPACVVMGNYEYAYYENLGGCHHIPLDAMSALVCLLPPLLFTTGWLGGRLLKRS